MHSRPLLDLRPPVPRSFVLRLSHCVSCHVVSWPEPRLGWVSHRRIITRALQQRGALPVVATDDAASAGVVIIAFVMLTVLCLSFG